MEIFVDTETLGLTSPLLSIQWGSGLDDPPSFILPWREPVSTTLELIEEFTKNTVVAWNLSFDWFQLTKWYNIFQAYHDRYGDDVPDPVKCWQIEQEVPTDWCLKPDDAIDLMVCCSTGPLQHLMSHKPIYIRRIPEALQDIVPDLIDQYLEFPIGCKYRWVISKNTLRPGLVDIRIDFNRRLLGLKHVHSLVPEEMNTAQSRGIDSASDYFDFKEFGTSYKPWGGDWYTEVIPSSDFSQDQIRYSLDDVTKMRDIWRWLRSNDYEPVPDTDSRLTAMVGAARWRGYAIDTEAIQASWPAERKDVPTYHARVTEWLGEAMNDVEKLVLSESTGRIILEEIKRWDDHPAAERADLVLRERKNIKIRDIFKKLLRAGRFHADLKVSGTLSNRMAGGGMTSKGGSINPQGIDRTMRNVFTMAYVGEEFCGGDFSGFEVSIFDAIVRDPELRSELQSGRKIHGVFGAAVYNLPYEEIISDEDLYNRSKTTFFLRMYGGQLKKAAETLDLTEEEAEKGLERWERKFPGIARYYDDIKSQYQFIDTKDWTWANPKAEVTSILGFTRKFDREISAGYAFWRLAEELKETDPWADVKIEVRRKDKAQTITQALRSALIGACFSLQGYVVRVAGNHGIQSPGGEITKKLQDELWNLQPVGSYPWRIRMLNIHDEILAVVSNSKTAIKTKQEVEVFIDSMRETIPLLDMEWKLNQKSWKELKG